MLIVVLLDLSGVIILIVYSSGEEIDWDSLCGIFRGLLLKLKISVIASDFVESLLIVI